MRKPILTLALLLLGATAALAPAPVIAESDGGPSFNPHSGPNAPYYRIRYLADLDDGEGGLIEHGVFDTSAQASEIINLLAHLTIAYRVDCSCEEYRRDVFGTQEMEEEILDLLPQYGYIPRLVPAPQVASLPEGYPVTTPYLRLSGNGFYGWWGGWGNWGWGYQTPTTMTFNANDPNLYARLTPISIFIDTRLESAVLSRVQQLMGGYQLTDPESLCAFIALDRSPDNMLSWVTILDQRRTWAERSGGAQ
ncbi:hypothetical protein IQ03_01318 [Gemmobacter caeni]|jgi:hypothetical protein|uniref:DUF4136 domain-containing protein n=1 Tax=Gemmobacter caeni TaxID=589035 RepID=A0A2T6B8M1_9RHOB|nr:hypothetical protein [Gemmobacter caeni]PTX52430.1 hypothetical protein C8N34_102209 [Gemmobacter caeni]TWJ02899.1 hypothetical protein IQ03_01318 [Gemmobacter caeni]